ncbi:MAG: glycosyltransferase [Patescibacteria group bacterium]
MKIAFITTQGLAGSTLAGRVLPLAKELSQKHEVHILAHGKSSQGSHAGVQVHFIGTDPFQKTASGKKRQRGVPLVLTILTNAIVGSMKLTSLKPDAVVIVKSLPENVLATQLALLVNKLKRVILDVDDFELTANVTSSWTQRAAIHWAERASAKIADHVVTATPFLSDHFEQLSQGKKPITMIPTGLSVPAGDATGAPRRTDRSASENRPVGVQERQDPPILLYAGSISLSSGHRIDLLPDILAEVRKKHPEIRLYIYGDGDDVEKVKQMFAEKSLEKAVVWHGRFALQMLLSNLPSNAILLDPVDGSITNRAKSSFRVALATALGLPIVTSDIGIRPYLIPDSLHERCFAKPGDGGDYVGKIDQFLEKPLSSSEQILVKEHAKQFSWETLAQEYEKIVAV